MSTPARVFEQSDARNFVQSPARARDFGESFALATLLVSSAVPFVGYVDPRIQPDWTCFPAGTCGDPGCRVPLPEERWLQLVTDFTQNNVSAGGGTCLRGDGTLEFARIRTTTRFSLTYGDLEYSLVETSCLASPGEDFGVLSRYEVDEFGNVSSYSWQAEHPGDPQNQACANAVPAPGMTGEWTTVGDDLHFDGHNETGSVCDDGSPSVLVDDLTYRYTLRVTRQDTEALAAALALGVLKDSVVSITGVDAQSRCVQVTPRWYGFGSNPANPSMTRITCVRVFPQRGFCGGRGVQEATNPDNDVAHKSWDRGTKAASPDGDGQPSLYLDPLPARPNIARAAAGWSRGFWRHKFEQPWDCECDIAGTPSDTGSVDGERFYSVPAACRNDYLTA